MNNDIETPSLLNAITARFYAIDVALRAGNIKAALEITTRCKAILPVPEQHNLDAAMNELKNAG